MKRTDSTRRAFIKTSAATAAGAALLPTASIQGAFAKTNKKKATSETLVKTLYDSLSPRQRDNVCFDFNHRLRHEIDNNWFIVRKHRIGDSYTMDQQAMISEIFMKMHSDEYADEVMRQVVDDSGRGGFEECSVALFGKPNTSKFQFVLTGRQKEHTDSCQAQPRSECPIELKSIVPFG